jgi:hypothetical protein
MEHWSCCDDPEASRQRVLLDAVPQFKLFDFGTAVIYPGEDHDMQTKEAVACIVFVMRLLQLFAKYET